MNALPSESARALRPDLRLMASHVREGERVLDVGCGDGALLRFLRGDLRADARGMDIDPDCVQACLSAGLPALQGDAEEILTHYPDHFFDAVLSAGMIQTTRNPKLALQQMARTAARCVISIPNFGWFGNRAQLLLGGRMPVNRHISYQWYDTPNIHFCTGKDFLELAEELGLRAVRVYPLAYGKLLAAPFRPFANALSQQMVFVLEKR